MTTDLFQVDVNLVSELTADQVKSALKSTQVFRYWAKDADGQIQKSWPWEPCPSGTTEIKFLTKFKPETITQWIKVIQ